MDCETLLQQILNEQRETNNILRSIQNSLPDTSDESTSGVTELDVLKKLLSAITGEKI